MAKRFKLFIVAVLSIVFVTCMSSAVAFASSVTGSNEEGVTGEVTLTSFQTNKGAQIRLTAPVGIRFLSEISVADLEKLPTNAQFGTLIIGTEKLGANELTLETETVENVVAEYWYTGSNDTTKIYTAVIGGEVLGDDFPAEYYAMDLTARGYVKYVDNSLTEHVIYADTTTRSMSYVAAAALASGENLGEYIEFVKSIADKALSETISFVNDQIIIPAGYAFDLDNALVGTSGIPAKYTVSPSATIENGKFSSTAAGSFTVTATIGSKSCSIDIIVSEVEKELVTSIYDMQLFTVENILNSVDITVPEINTAEIDNLFGGTFTVKDDTTITVALEDTTSVGERSLILQVGSKLYSLTICVADEIINTADEFNAMRIERIGAVRPSSTKYYALNADIAIADNKFNSAHPYGESYSYYDIFDGRGHMITPSTDAAVWNNGLFCNLSAGAGVKNIILKDFMARGYAGGCDGTVAYQLSNGSFLDNIVVINPVLRDASGYATGMLVGRVYEKSEITNCLVLDLNSINGVANSLANGYDPETKLYNGEPIGALVGNAASNYTLANISNSYALTKNTAYGVLRDKVEVLSGTVFTTFDELLEGVDDLSAYKLIQNDGITICVNGTEIYSYPKNILVNNLDAEIIESNEAEEYFVTIPPSVSVNDISIVLKATIITRDSATNKIKLKFDETIRGEKEVVFSTSTNVYSIYVCIADMIITTGEQFNQQVLGYTDSDGTTKYTGRIFETKQTTIDRKYIALANDIKIEHSKQNVKEGRYWGGNWNVEDFFYDTFDGRGHTIEAKSAGTYIWTKGLFGVMLGATVKNVVIKDAYLRDDGIPTNTATSSGNVAGVIATGAQDGSVIENCVIINPAMRTNDGSNVAYSMLVGVIYGNCIIRNNLIIDGITGCTNTNYVNGTKYDGASKNSYLVAFFADIGGSYVTGGTFSNNYCISANGYYGGFDTSGGRFVATSQRFNENVVTDYEAFKTASGENYILFTLLNDNRTTVTVGGEVIYSK